MVWRPSFIATLRIPGYGLFLASTIRVQAAFAAEMLTTGWFVLQLTDSPLWVGVAAGVRGVSQLVFSVTGGQLADRASPRRLLLWGQRSNAALYGLLCLFIVLGAIHVWVI